MTPHNYLFYIGLTTNSGIELRNRLSLRTLLGEISRIVQAYGVSGFNVVTSHGCWQGVTEECLNLTVSGIGPSSATLLASELAAFFCQDCVAYHSLPEMVMVGADAFRGAFDYTNILGNEVAAVTTNA